jgi:hypothetical protein
MPDRCLRCHRPIQSDLDWMERTMPAGACRATGDAECEARRGERYRLMERIVRAASDYLLVPETYYRQELARALADLTALDGEG